MNDGDIERMWARLEDCRDLVGENSVSAGNEVFPTKV